MGAEKKYVFDPPASLITKLWILAVLGLIFPSAIMYSWPDMTWAGKTARAHRKSLSREVWQSPWQAIDQETFSSGWVRCGSIEDALALDRKIDDGYLHTGKLVLSEGGLAWIPQ